MDFRVSFGESVKEQIGTWLDEKFMSASDYNGWQRMTCSFCGYKSKVYISILISTENSGIDNPYPFSQTDMCRQCWLSHGIDAAFEHNKECINDLSEKDEKKDS